MSNPVDFERRFHEGLCLAAGNKDEQAGAAFMACLIADPGCAEILTAFLANLRRRFPSRPEAPPANAADLAAPLKQAAARQDWAEVFQSGPRRLAIDPWNVPALLAMAQACAANEFSEAEAGYWRAVVDAAADDKEVQQQAGEAFARLRHFGEALSCWRRVEQLDPDNDQTPRRIVELTIAKSRQRGGIEQPPAAASARRRKSIRPVYAPHDSRLGSAAHSATLSPIQQLEAEIRERPSVPELYLQLAQIYLDKDREYDADRLLAKGREATDRDPRVQAMWEEVAMHRHANRVRGAEEDVKTADAASEEKARQALAQATKDRDRAELDVFRSRCQRQPDNAAHNYELGLRLKRIDKLPDACQYLEKAISSPEQKCAAALELGHCHVQLGDNVKALNYYRLAAHEIASTDHGDAKQQAAQCASKLAESMKLARLSKRYLATNP